jgi:hypothetical protein
MILIIFMDKPESLGVKAVDVAALVRRSHDLFVSCNRQNLVAVTQFIDGDLEPSRVVLENGSQESLREKEAG